MRIFVAGATGVLGRRLVPLLVEGGHQVTATTRTPGKAAGLRATGAEPVVADALDRDAVLRAVVAARPEVVVHQLTALAGTISFRGFDQAFALTNRLRTEGTDHLLEAARAAGTRRFVAQSFAGWPFARVGGPVKTEGDPLDPDPRPSCGAPLTPSATWSRPCSGPKGSRGSCSATAASTARGPRPGRAAPCWRTCAAAASRSSAPAPACGPSSTSTTPPRPRWPPSSGALLVSTRSSTTTRRRCRRGCPPWPPPSAPRRRGGSRPGWAAWSPVSTPWS